MTGSFLDQPPVSPAYRRAWNPARSAKKLDTERAGFPLPWPRGYRGLVEKAARHARSAPSGLRAR